MKTKISPEIEIQALKVAKGLQKSGQTKEQTKLIARGIEKGIAEYKKQHNKKLRELDKQRKQKIKQRDPRPVDNVDVVASQTTAVPLPWILLGISWLGFLAYSLFEK